MPVDHKRLPIPEESKSPECFVPQQPCSVSFKQRKDGRQSKTLRAIHLQCGTISQARGSSYLEIGHTKVICAVYGPREVTKKEDFSMYGQLQCEFRFATFASVRRRPHEPDDIQRDLSIIVQEALQPAVQLDKFPKARMDVFITVLEDDGSALAAAITCSSAALINAGIELYDTVVAASVRQFEDIKLVDPCKDEEYPVVVSSTEAADDGQITVAFMPSINQVSSVYQVGYMSLERSNALRQLALEAAQSLYLVVRQQLKDHFKRELADSNN